MKRSGPTSSTSNAHIEHCVTLPQWHNHHRYILVRLVNIPVSTRKKRTNGGFRQWQAHIVLSTCLYWGIIIPLLFADGINNGNTAWDGAIVQKTHLGGNSSCSSYFFYIIVKKNIFLGTSNNARLHKRGSKPSLMQSRCCGSTNHTSRVNSVALRPWVKLGSNLNHVVQSGLRILSKCTVIIARFSIGLSKKMLCYLLLFNLLHQSPFISFKPVSVFVFKIW